MNYRWLSPDELKGRLHNTKTLQQSTTIHLARLRVKIAQTLDKHSIDLDVTSHNDVKAIMEQSAETALCAHPPVGVRAL